MQRKDVQVGVEYAATAPLAYGREPREHPRRVRFTDTRPGPWLQVVTTEYAEQASSVMGGAGWNRVDVRIVHARSADGVKALDELPHSLRDALLAKYGVDEPYQRKSIGGKVEPGTRRSLPHPLPAAIGDRLTYADDSIKGGLPGEAWRDNRWITALVQPADIHRTWEAVEVNWAKRQAEQAELDAKVRIPELNQLLATIGLDRIMRFTRSGSSAVYASVDLVDRNGERLLADLTKWATEHQLIAGIEV